MILDHIDAIATRSRHHVYLFNSTLNPQGHALDLDEFDVVVIHYSLYSFLGEQELGAGLRRKIRAFRGLKIQFIQDDYRWVNATTEAMRFMGIDVLFTLVPESEHGKIWSNRLPGVQLITYLAGYIPDRLVGRVVSPLADRPIDVGYRSRPAPFWLGAMGHNKVRIGQGFSQHAAPYGLRCDISWKEQDRLYGIAWDRFNESCRAMLGCGSGASIADFDGSCERAVKRYQQARPDAPFAEVAASVLRPYEGSIDLDVISPRHFEAIAARTSLVLFPGPYSGILRPWEHYIPLERDFSNMPQVVARLRDVPQLEAMTAKAYDDVIGSGRHSYAAFVRFFDEVVDRNRKRDHHARPTKTSYQRASRNLLRRLRLKCVQAMIYPLDLNQPLRFAWWRDNQRQIMTLPCLPLQRAGSRVLRGIRWFYRLASRAA